MILKYKKLKSGETYKLSDILSEDNRVIIPDLQRDYCWGNKKTSSDVSKTYAYAFVEGLLNNLSNDSLNLGLIYGYEAPAGHIQLCDGQQRFTTLFLLIGMIRLRCIYFIICLIMLKWFRCMKIMLFLRLMIAIVSWLLILVVFIRKMAMLVLLI